MSDATVTATKETLGFQTEVKQLLQLMIHSLYSNREIFLRELISNASDACDKLRFEALHNAALFEGDSDFKIRVAFDPAAKTLTIADNGVGMSREEVITNLGTIAKSGTREFFLQAVGRPAEGRQPDRPVRRRLLLLVHRRRQGHGAHAPRRRRAQPGRALGIRGHRRIQYRDGRPADARQPRSPCTSRKGRTTCCRAWKLKSIIRKYSDPHRPAHRDEGREVG
jgi:hypothetical protein